MDSRSRGDARSIDVKLEWSSGLGNLEPIGSDLIDRWSVRVCTDSVDRCGPPTLSPRLLHPCLPTGTIHVRWKSNSNVSLYEGRGLEFSHY